MERQRPIFIAEIKTKSPFGFQSAHSFNELMEYAINYGDWISVHDNALWGGDFETIAYVRKFTHKPILAKGLHTSSEDVRQALEHGATHVLRVDAKPSNYTHLPYTLYEYSNIHEADKARLWFAQTVRGDMKFVCNSRDLRTGKVKEGNELNTYLGLGNWVCQASNIAKPDDVNPNVNAFIVGTNLIEYCKAL